MNKIELFKNKLPFDYELNSLHDDLHDAIIFSVTGEKKAFLFAYIDTLKYLTDQIGITQVNYDKTISLG